MVRVDVRKIRNRPDPQASADPGRAMTLSQSLQGALTKMAPKSKPARASWDTIALEELREWIADECYPSMALSPEALEQLLDWLDHGDQWNEQLLTQN